MGVFMSCSCGKKGILYNINIGSRIVRYTVHSRGKQEGKQMEENSHFQDEINEIIKKKFEAIEK